MTVTLEELTGWLKQQRWFGGKGVPISRVEILERIPLQSAAEAEASIVRVSYVLGTAETYLVLLQRMPDGTLRDALEDPGVARAVLDFTRDARLQPGATNLLSAVRGSLIAAHTGTFTQPRILAHLGLQPVFDVGLGHGEGTGAAMVFPLIDQVAALAAGG